MNMKLMLLTTDEEMIKEAEEAGIDRIFVDLEYINKRERQRGRNTLISNNTVEDVKRVRDIITKSELLVRINPINPNTHEEIEKVIEYGADIIMLPMVVDEYEVMEFIKMVNGRCKIHLLLETAQSVARINRIISVEGIDEIHLGLNDMHIGMQLDFMFELLSGGIVEYLASRIKSANIPFGFGGIAKIGEGGLPAEMILGEHYRLGSSAVILSRTFRNERDKDDNRTLNLKEEILKIRKQEDIIKNWDKSEFYSNKKQVEEIVQNIVSRNR